MNSIKDLWKRRIRFLVKLYYDFIAFQLDLVSLAYIIGMLIFVGYYYFPELGGYIDFIRREPFSYFLYFFSIKVATGGKHTGYLKEADELFLTPLQLYGREFLRRSHNLNRLLGGLTWGLWVGILVALEILEVNPWGFFIVGLLWRFGKMNVTFFIEQAGGKWIRRILRFLASLFILPLTFAWIFYWDRDLGEGLNFIVFSILLFGLLVWTEKIKGKSSLHWSRMITHETNHRAQRLSAIIQVVPEEKSRGINTDRTLKIFSGRKILPFTPLGAALLAFGRRLRRGRGNLSLLLKIALVHLGASVFVEGIFVRTILHLLVFLLMHEFLLSLWNGVLDEEWFHVYPFPDKAVKRGITLGSLGYIGMYMTVTIGIQILRWGNGVEELRTFGLALLVLYLVNQWRGSTVFYEYRDRNRKKGRMEHERDRSEGIEEVL